jgi:selenocysteine lyase/cysteine desulfurase
MPINVARVRLHDKGVEQCGIVSFTRQGREPDEITRMLAAKRINVSTSSNQSTLLDMTARQLDLVVRASVHYYNTDDEVDRFCAEIEALH